MLAGQHVSSATSRDGRIFLRERLRRVIVATDVAKIQNENSKYVDEPAFREENLPGSETPCPGMRDIGLPGNETPATGKQDT